MTKLLEQAIEAVRRLPEDSQDEIARTILHLAESEMEAEPVDPAHLAAVLEGLAQAKQREFPTDREVAARWRCFDVTIPVDAEAAKALESSARREAVGRYLSGLLKGGRVRDVLAEAIADAKREARARGLKDEEIGAELDEWRAERRA